MYETPSYHPAIAPVQRVVKMVRIAGICAAVLLIIVTLAPQPVKAVTPITDDLDEQSDPLLNQNRIPGHTEQLIRRAQAALKTLGFYSDTVSGKMDNDTGLAIRRYQKSKNLPPTDVISEALVNELEAAASISSLLQRLSVARQTRTQEIRDALLGNPATRDLILDNAADATADPTRDPTRCYEEPTVRCLLVEALENAKAVTSDNMRDWAYSDILVSQARAGLPEAARDTVRHISDPRMIMLALGEIAESQAYAGQAESAIAAADAVPDMETRLEAYANMASILAARGYADGTRVVVDKLREHIESSDLTIKRAALEARASAALFQIGDGNAARQMLTRIEDAAETSLPREQRDIALRYVADTLANAGHVTEAISKLQNIDSAAERLPVLMSAARIEATEGDPEAAMVMARSIEAVRYRSLVLVSIAEGQAKKGDTVQAIATLDTAVADMETIDLPFARDFAKSRIALAYARIGTSPGGLHGDAYLRASSHAAEISNSQLAAYSTWKIAFIKNDAEGHMPQDDIAAATIATGKIDNPSSRIWLLAELAEEQAEAGDSQRAWQLFNRAFDTSIPITNTWKKSRALSRLALTMIRLVETGVQQQ